MISFIRKLDYRAENQKLEEEIGNNLQEVLIWLVALEGAEVSVLFEEYVFPEHACSYATSTTYEKNQYYFYPEISELDALI